MDSDEMFKTPPAKSEFVTRKEIVDRRLKEAGWRIVRFDAGKSLSAYERCAVEEYPTENGPADYALCAGGNVLGIVEAKKLTLGPQNVLTQAERYSKGLVVSPYDFRGFHVPFDTIPGIAGPPIAGSPPRTAGGGDASRDFGRRDPDGTMVGAPNLRGARRTESAQR